MVRAVDDVSLQINDGEFFALLGPSGCGKTTTLRCIAGLETPDEGRILFGDDVIVDRATKTEVPVHRRDIGMVFQSYALWPHMNVYGNVAYPLRVEGQSKPAIRAKVGEALALVGLAGFDKRAVSALSGGQQQRVALARALVRSPRVLLLDEPLSNLDSALRAQMRTELRRIHLAAGRSTVYVTHDQLEAATLSDRIVVMRDGIACQQGSPQEIFGRPKNRWIATFLGFDNVVAGTVARVEADGSAIAIPGWAAPVHYPQALDLRPGAAAAIAVRGTSILLTPRQADDVSRPTPVNTFPGTVLNRTYLGNLMEYVVDVAGTALRVHAAESALPTDSRDVEVHLPVDSFAVVPEEEGS